MSIGLGLHPSLFHEITSNTRRIMKTEPGRFRPTEVAQPNLPETEEVVDPHVERSLKLVEDYFKREFRGGELRTFADELDQIEMTEILFLFRRREEEKGENLYRPLTGERKETLREVIVEYRASLAERKTLGKTRLERGSENGLLELLEDVHKLRDVLLKMRWEWADIFHSFVYRQARQTGQPFHVEAELGTVDASRIGCFFEIPSEIREPFLGKYPELTEACARFQLESYPNLARRLQETEQGLNVHRREHL